MPPSGSSVLVQLRLIGGQAFARDAGRAGSSLGRVGTAGSAAQRGLRALSGAGEHAQGILRGVGLAAGAAAAASGIGAVAGVKAFVGFEQQMDRVQAVSMASGAEMQALGEQAKQLGADTSFSAAEAAEGMYSMATQGFTAQEVMKAMPGTLALAAASATDLGEAAATQASVIRAFGLEVSDAGSVADTLTMAVNKSAIEMDDLASTMSYVAPVASKFDQSFEDMAASVAILGNVGISGSRAGTALRGALNKLVKPTAKTVEVMRDAGISSERFDKIINNAATGKMRDLPSIIGSLAAELRDVDGATRRKTLAQLFGTEALPGMMTLIGEGEDKIRAMSQAMTDSGGTAEKTAAIMRDNVAGAWDEFTGSVETAGISLTERFGPAMAQGLKGAAGAVNDLTADLGRIPAAMAAGRGGGGEGFTGVAGMFADLGRSGLVDRAIGMFKTAGAAVGDAIGQVIDALKPAMPFLQNVVGPLLLGLAKGVLGGVVAAFSIAVPVIRVVSTVLGALGRVLEPLRPVIEGIGIVAGVVFGPAILGAAARAVTFLARGAGPVLGAALGVAHTAISALRAPLTIATGAVRKVFGALGVLVKGLGKGITFVQRFAGTMTGGARKVILAATNMVQGVIHKVTQLPGKVAALAQRVITFMANKLGNGVRTVASAAGKLGKGLVDGVINAIKGAPGAIGGALRGLVPDKLKNVFDDIFGGGGEDVVPRALGGRVRPGELTLVGEEGPELARFPAGTNVTPSPQTQRMLSGQGRGGGARVSAMAPMRPIVIPLTTQLDGKIIHQSVVNVERDILERT